MQFSPLAVALLATSAAFGLSNAANGQTVDAPSADADSASISIPIAPADLASGEEASKRRSSPPSQTFKSIQPSLQKPVIPAKNITPLQTQKPGQKSTQKLADKPVEKTPRATIALPVRISSDLSSADVLFLPLVIAQAGAGQESPDRLQINPFSPGQSQPSAPQIPAPTAPTETAPTTPSTPAPETPTTPVPETAPPSTPPQTSEPEPRVLVSEVVVSGAEGDLVNEVYGAIRTQPGRTTTRSQLQEDINAIFATGYFSNVRAVPEDTPLGVRVTFEVTPNPILRSVQLEGNTVLPPSEIEKAFGDQYSKILNLNALKDGIKILNQWYQDNGYVLAQVLDSPAVSPDGVVTLQVAEGQVEAVKVRFINKEGEDVDSKTGKPIRGRTRDFIVTREFQTKPGDIFNRRIIEQDLQRAFGLGIFDDIRLSLQPSETDPRKVIVIANVVEKNAGSIFASAGISSASGLFGSVGYQQNNLGGNNQKLGAEVQVGQRELLFDLNFTDPWIGGDPFRTSYTINLFRRRTISLIFDGGEREVNLPNGDTPRILRTGGILSFTRPLSRDVFRRAEWIASLGLQYQRVSIRDSDGRLSPVDELGNSLSFSGTGRDDLLSLQFGIVQDRRNDVLRPTSGSLLRLGTEQFLPIGEGNILGNRLRGSYSYYIPTQLAKFTAGCRKVNPTPADCPQTLAFNIQGGAFLGDLPPYEAFALGGSNSVRGYGEGELAAARDFIQGTIEYRFPVFNIISGALFVDGAYGFGSQGLVPGNPGGNRGKPGKGYGYGLGVRVQSPLGPIRVDFGINDQGDTQFSFGIGERF
ncbi:BamA/TamA family outer membrane protein [Leptodesmis sp.]|uniref:BamA/TamA family outer membrane protein n=1 Tax=Leptodesmis sp. TaxID=3100501 RepID=UPI0040534632